ncbi:carboxypeptidase-like regulatory domain-containing protein [Fulvivirga sedimenti]|uniref:Carboxypeptidase-like regulatory domain-containing protein n=1 Tax=Fulvivirga sedimenti TaxID=2879465 RepID=A0A9X1L207_9BACT|nr:carboxypeptidase-like regulatory domain-containing protein [Fulvivirga sedimenti]MCA6075321.1 carboxypeptidase-like regulatory domain-containing protein [Fulvivirga sedimenti]MCA6076498.1 carboxypeptidase-like regulatory domain-containing protein [Fulvivirga sedimenti]MCA6077626.1 carboxypeptidase-like regulatory domain-containing protein [Fulvivirga sedimenti]
MPLRIFTILFCLIACKAAVFGQTNLPFIEIEGEIRESDTKDPVPYVHIMNPNSGLGTVSNTEGRFWMKMMPSDTILFSAIGYETYAFTLNPDQNSRRLRIVIELNTSTQVLKPVNIFAYRDEESLKQALIELEVPDDNQNVALQIPGVRTGPMTENPVFQIGGPFSFFHNKFSREAKASRKLEKDIATYDYTKILKAKYNEQVVMQLTGLPEDEVEEFMNFCKIDEAYIYSATEYDIALLVSDCLKKFNEQPGD